MHEGVTSSVVVGGRRRIWCWCAPGGPKEKKKFQNVCAVNGAIPTLKPLSDDLRDF